MTPLIDCEPNLDKSLGPSSPRIRCPLCGWSPRNRWSYNCGHEWNTFGTGGVCPACLHKWASTQCLKCGGWSPHSDRYKQMTKFRLVPSAHEQTPRTGHFGTVSEPKP